MSAQTNGDSSLADESQTQAVISADKNSPAEKEKTEALAAEESISLDEAKKLRREAQSLRKRLLDFEEAEQKRQEKELSEAELLKKRLAEKDALLKDLTKKELQREVATKVGLPLNLASRLQGETADELEADAQALLGILPKSQPQTSKVNPTNPGQNASGNGETDAQRMSKLYGESTNIFDPVTISKLGGGVFTNVKTDDT